MDQSELATTQAAAQSARVTGSFNMLQTLYALETDRKKKDATLAMRSLANMEAERLLKENMEAERLLKEKTDRPMTMIDMADDSDKEGDNEND
jgi:hypothetical protein